MGQPQKLCGKTSLFFQLKNRPKNSSVVKPQFRLRYVCYNDFFLDLKKEIGNFFHEKLNFCVVKQQSICVKTLSPNFL